MTFPVSNKPTAILKSSYIITCLLVIFSLLYLYMPTIHIIVIALAVTIPLLIYSFFYLKKQSIQYVELDQNKLIVSYNKKKIEIPLSKIQNIDHGHNMGLDFNFYMTRTYIIRLKSRYDFGNKLLIDYKIDKSQTITNNEDPISIKVLKLELNRLQN